MGCEVEVVEIVEIELEGQNIGLVVVFTVSCVIGFVGVVGAAHSGTFSKKSQY